MTKLLDAVQPHMPVVTADGAPVGSVDHEEGEDHIKLTEQEGRHKYVSWDWVDRVDEGKLVLNLARAQLEKAWKSNPEGRIR